jgi:O-antigen/teichoic acid export membrane protein
MSPTNPQFLYMILVLPSLFGLALLGDGINKLVHEEWEGVISMFFGFICIAAVFFTFLFFSSYFAHKVV